MYSLFFPVLKGQSLVNYRDYMVNSFLITSSKENIDRSTIRTRAVCPVLDVLFAGQIDRNSGNVYPTRDTKLTPNRCQQAREAWALHVSGTKSYIYHRKSHRPPPPDFFF